MPENEQGTAQQSATTGETGQQTEQQSQTAVQPGQTTETQQQSQTPAALEQLQTQLREAQESARKAQESAKYFQSEFTRSRQQAQALAGVAPQVDPLAEDIQFFTKQGYSETDARSLVEYTNRKIAPLQQENQRIHAAQQATGLVDHVIYSTQQANPALITDPEIYQATRNELLRVANQGQANMLTPEYVENFVVLEQYHRQKGRTQVQPNQQPQQVNRPPLNFMGGAQPGFTPAMPVQQQRQADPAVDAVAAAMAKHGGYELK